MKVLRRLTARFFRRSIGETVSVYPLSKGMNTRIKATA